MAALNPFANKKNAEKLARQRRELWPAVTDDQLWLPSAGRGEGRVGYGAVPRTMPIIMRIMDGWADSVRVSTTYLALWLRDMGSGVVNIGSEEEMAFESGFNGSRAVYQWKERMKLLLDMGFIDRKESAKGAWSHILLWNPHQTIKALKEKDKDKYPVEDRTWNALLSRMREISATDLDPPAVVAPPPSPPAAHGIPLPPAIPPSSGTGAA